MKLLHALREIGEWCFAHRERAAVSLGSVWLLILWLWWVGGPHPIISGPPALACWCLGLHIRLQSQRED